MKIGFCFDHNTSYGFEKDDLTYCDFASPATVSFVKKTLEKCGYQVELIGNYKNLILQLNKAFDCDIIFSTAEGIKSRNRESWIASIAEMHEIPYVGTDAYGLVVTLDKALTKIIANYINIRTPDFIELSCMEDINAIPFEFPFIIKPNYEGSSMGVKLIIDKTELHTYTNELFSKYSQKLIAEKYICGKEITVSIYEENGKPCVFGMIESIQKNGDIMPIYSSEIKRIYGCQKIIPRISNGVKDQLAKDAIRIYNYLGCKDYCRIDFRLDKDDNPYLLEVTPLPALSETASYMMAAKLNHIPPEKILKTIIENAYARF